MILKYNVKITCLISALHLQQERCKRGEQYVRNILYMCFSIHMPEIDGDILCIAEFFSFTFNFQNTVTCGCVWTCAIELSALLFLFRGYARQPPVTTRHLSAVSTNLESLVNGECASWGLLPSWIHTSTETLSNYVSLWGCTFLPSARGEGYTYP